MIDTHTHLYFPEYGEDIEKIISDCIESGVSHFILPGVNEESIEQVKDFHLRYPEITSMAIGLHPTEVTAEWLKLMDTIDKEVNTGKYKAIGEIGLDLHWDPTYLKEQKEAFEYQLKIAERFNLPVIIHSRDALDETLDVIRSVKPTVPLIFHSFTGNKEDVRKIRSECNPFFGINGVVTYKNAPTLREALGEIGLDKILLETDAPYLTPVPHRGKRNDSSYLIYIKEKIAEVLSKTPQEIEAKTDKTARSIFGI